MRRVKSVSVFIPLACGVNQLGKRNLSLKGLNKQDAFWKHFTGWSRSGAKVIDLECKSMCAFELSTSVFSNDDAGLAKI